MAAIDHSAYVPDTASPFTTFAQTLRDLKRKAWTHIAYRQTVTALGKLSARQLDDIGIDAANIDAVARSMSKQHTT